ncbi:MAG TPA: biotin-dependent carboxyltransferase family protein [Xanthomonadaceae bacterium]|nr:biotin-dependent carboxyltransferase family protein [Xanthomonadaceae bacterium]
MSVRVLAPGLQATVQDGGRHGFRHLGVGTAGALDPYSHAVANLLVGNPVDAPVLEAALAGPSLRFERPARIALCGATVDARVGDVPVPGWRPVDLPAGSELHVGRCREGARIYLAVAGGWSVPKLLGSGSTDLRGGFGGMRGRALASGDVLPVARTAEPTCDALRLARWWIDPAPDLAFTTAAIVRILSGHDMTDPGDALYATPWRVAAASDRQGLRLEGAALALDPASSRVSERVSEPVAPGTVQLPAGGQPIVLLADAQTHGGYPRIGHAIASDLPRLAQLRPGDTVRFAPCTPLEAARLRREQASRLARIALAVGARQWGA